MARDLTLASYNVHWGRGLRWTGYKPFDVTDACRGLDADVIALQESWGPDDGEAQHDAAARELGLHVVSHPLARAVADPTPAVVARLGPEADLEDATLGDGTWSLALLSRFPITVSRVDPLPQLRFDPTSRAVLRAELDVDGARLVVCVTHLPHIQMGAPFITRALRRALPSVDEPAVLVGDMNTWSPCISAMAPKGWRRRGRGRSFPSPYPHSRIDHLLVTPRVEVVWDEVVANTSSDHRPIRAGLRFT
jgi:endonuclease/exonuclease/phosphatase family metal-dependent hydrolase